MKKIFPIVSFFLPAFALAQTSSTLDDFITYWSNVLVFLIKLMIPLAVAFFFWQMIKFVHASREGKSDLGKSKDMMIWTGIALLFMVSIWSIVAYVQKSAGTNIQSGIQQQAFTPQPGQFF